MSLVTSKTMGDRAADSVIYAVLTLFALCTLFPIYFVLVMSITPLKEVVQNGGFVLWPNHVTLEAYKAIFDSPVIPQALKITVIVTLLGTLCNLTVTTLLAYPLSKRFVPGRSAILLAIVFTMLFSGGLIPLYLVVRGTGLLDSIWALIVPGLVSTFNLLIMKTYFENLPAEVEEAARVDGCDEVHTLFRIVIPLSLPMLATLGLFYGVGHWNAYFAGIMYLQDKTLYPIQVVLRNMIQTPAISQDLMIQNPLMMQQLPPETLKMATVAIATVPILAIYPFVQKYFIRGMLIGAIKG